MNAYNSVISKADVNLLRHFLIGKTGETLKRDGVNGVISVHECFLAWELVSVRIQILSPIWELYLQIILTLSPAWELYLQLILTLSPAWELYLQIILTLSPDWELYLSPLSPLDS